MPRRNNTPILLRIIPAIFPYLEHLLPFIAYPLAARIFLTPFRYKTPNVEKDFVKSGNRFELQIASKKIAGFSWGKGRTIICVHGWSGRGSMFHEFIEPLVAKNFRVVIFDGPAHGLSEGTSTDVLEFEEVILQLEKKFEPVVGYATHSFGGTAALFAFSKEIKPKPIVLAAVPAMGEEVVKVFRERINGSRRLIKKIEEYTERKYGRSFYEISAEHTSKSLGDTPALVIHDKTDRDVPVEHGEKLMEVLINGTFIRTTGLGHNRILRDKYVIEKTIEFLAQHCR